MILVVIVVQSVKPIPMEFNKEAELLLSNTWLIDGTSNITGLFSKEQKAQWEFISKNFCGIKVLPGEFNPANLKPNSLVYLCGNISESLNQINWQNVTHINIVSELAVNFPFDILESDVYRLVKIGQVPINVHNMGVLFPELFCDDTNYFQSISDEHTFQTLTESNKPSNAFRTGIYLTPINKTPNGNGLEFNLLRCSSNLAGPTDNFRQTDNIVTSTVNTYAQSLFANPACMNHVLAQTYHNSIEDNKEKKAKIKDHSDKTKDMPSNGLMGFCSFYEGYTSSDRFSGLITPSDSDPWDFCYKETSVLTKLRFRLKSCVQDDSFVKLFDVILYPNSVFLMSLSTNRLYTHEIVPSSLPVDKIPTRMGYVVRCSKTKAIYANGKTWIQDDAGLVEMCEPDPEGVSELKTLYWKENVLADKITYSKFNFSLNSGDYLEPNI